MAALASQGSVEFDVKPHGAYAVQLRLTPALLEALLKAQETGQAASIRFGAGPQGNEIVVGGAAFRINALPEESCDLLRLPTGRGGAAHAGDARPALIGAVRQKLLVQRNIQDERGRVRARAEEAERRGHERKAQLLDGKPAGATSKPGHKTVVQRTTPPPTTQRRMTPPPQHPPHLQPQQPQPQQQPQQPLTASMLAAPASRPPTHPATGAAVAAAAAAAAAGRPAGRSATPPPTTAATTAGAAGAGASAAASGAGTAAPAAAGAKMHKSASTGKLGLGTKHGSTASLGGAAAAPAPLATATPLVLQAARAGSLRLCLIAMLSERPMAMKGIKDVLADAASKVRSFKKPGKDELERAVKAVSEFKYPGKYVLYSMLLRELDELAPAGAAAQPPPRSSASPPTQSDEPVAAASAGTGTGTGAGGTAAGNGRGRLKKAGSVGASLGAAGQLVGSGATAGKPAPAAGAGVTGGKRSRLDWTDDDDSEPEPAVPPQQRLKQQQIQAPQRSASDPTAAAPPAATGTASGSPPSVGGGSGRSGGPGGSGSSGGGADGAAAAGAAGGPPQRRTSSSRGSDHADESWIEEHADRQPEPAAPIHSREEYLSREATFNAKYRIYFELHQLIQAHKKDMEALAAAVATSASDEERDRLRRDIERLHRRRGERAKRWDAAYRVLHQELSATKARMRDYVDQLQRQHQQQQQAAVGAAAAGAPGAPPVVRVQ